ncbi:maestro heat-like repeat-containing protein family member 2A [Sciurus carolinensis]|uniref:maestro heat-like repeat-containing protein family member 2A n=1 Tax=Sciurus carolinensis TaxID=30640 RepID=UPI001FB46FD6|nr:maestro heat-like repeat-containing protein family member 2A [Sciurus carolinensis]
MVCTPQVSLPILITLVCHPNNILAFVTLSKAATEVALKARTLGRVPYLSSFHLKPDQVISPQKLLTHLIMLSLKPYREKEFGVSSLRLLFALHPITSLHPVINSSVGQVWKKEIPQMLRILDDHTEKTLNQKEWEERLLQFSGQSLMAINDDDWLKQLTKAILEKINYFSDDEEKAFLYKFFGFTLRTSRNLHLVKTTLLSILNSAHEELQEREERDQVKISAISALSYMLRRIFKFKPGSFIRKEVFTFLVPLLLSIQDNNIEVVKACGGALTEWTHVLGWSSLTETFRHTTLSDHIQAVEETCKFLVDQGKYHHLGEVLYQSFGFLKRPQPFLRAAAVNFIGLTTKSINMNRIHENDVQLIRDALENVKNDPKDSIKAMVNVILTKVDEDVKFQGSHTSRLSQMSNNFLKGFGIKTPDKKKRLFKIVKRDVDIDENH